MSIDITHTGQPFVSVIVPVYNDAQRIDQCIEALLNQTYARDCYEILIVDNGSTDTTREVIKRHPVTLLVEDTKQSSYAARNKGLAHARGAIIAFTDSDCTPVPEWLAEGVRPIVEQQADLVGGNVRFVFSSRPTGAEVYDSLTNMQMEQNIRDRGVGKTANLFVAASAFNQVGLLPDNVQSGGDVTWTGRATECGLRLVYTPSAEVAHPTRQLAELLRKQYRVGGGQRVMKTKQRFGASTPKRSNARWKQFLPRSIMPLSPIALARTLRRRNVQAPPLLFARIWVAAWLCTLATTLGRAVSPVGVSKERNAQQYAAH